jgi:hypothetical protein
MKQKDGNGLPETSSVITYIKFRPAMDAASSNGNDGNNRYSSVHPLFEMVAGSVSNSEVRSFCSDRIGTKRPRMDGRQPNL